MTQGDPSLTPGKQPSRTEGGEGRGPSGRFGIRRHHLAEATSFIGIPRYIVSMVHLAE